MRWPAAYSTALLVGAFSSSVQAFTPLSSPRVTTRTTTTTTRTTSTTHLHVGRGWENDNFLDSLGRGDEERDLANEEYKAKSRYQPEEEEEEKKAADDLSAEGIEGAELTKDMVEKVKASHNEDEERSGGGSMFKNLLERAQQGPSVPRGAAIPPPPPTPATPQLENMTVEEQARMFREMMMQQQQQQQGGALPPPPQQQQQQQQPAAPIYPQQQQQAFPQAYPPQGQPLAPDGRKVGRNRDADAVVNSADVYFAQLKTDSKSRIMARLSGDEEFANQVFKDPRIQEIKVHVNPHLEEMKRKEQALLETSADEMLLPPPPEEPEMDRSYAGIRYKEKLQQRRQKKAGGAGAPASAVAEVPAVEAPAVATAPAPVPPPVVEAPAVPAATAAPALVPPPAAAAPVTAAPPVAAAPAAAPTGDLSQDIRTTQGLLLKHRGGPGFGSGRLRGNDIQRFEGLAQDVVGALRGEAAQQAAQNPPTTMQLAGTTTASAAAGAAADSSRADSMIACLEGAMLLYKNSPVELQESVLVTLRAALVAAVSTCNDLIADSSAGVPSSVASSDSIPAMVACLEGAILLYKNSPPELHSSVLVTLRATLMAAIGTCNAVIADAEVQNLQAYQSTVSGGAATKPMINEYTDVVQEPAAVTPAPAAPEPAAQANVAETTLALDDPNTPVLERVYAKLQDASGDGKMGLRKDLPVEDAKALANDVAEMRSILVNELQEGVPKPSPEGVPNSSQASSGSLYQKLLAKAKAEKESKK